MPRFEELNNLATFVWQDHRFSKETSKRSGDCHECGLPNQNALCLNGSYVPIWGHFCKDMEVRLVDK